MHEVYVSRSDLLFTGHWLVVYRLRRHKIKSYKDNDRVAFTEAIVFTEGVRSIQENCQGRFLATYSSNMLQPSQYSC